MTRLLVQHTCFMELSPLTEVCVLLSWVRYNPFIFPYGCSLSRLSGGTNIMSSTGFEPVTSRLKAERSTRLSYEPK